MSLSGFNATTEMISSVREVQVNDFCAVAASALVVFEHLCTLSAEAKYMWGSNMNYIKVLFYLNRSAVLVMTVLNWMPTNGFATFGFIMTNFSTPLSSIIVSRFLLDIRQAANAPPCETLDSSLFGAVSDSAMNRRSQTDAVLFANRNIDVAISIENNTFAESKATTSALNT
ncbi:hypothetical protein CERSUDRAFT_98958 [Gelatoporia subvermispora B]|uniref:DUF6533 domain-containing protein n=1 Tax=Ceriporiopsis subvermispora (strain B) TaxID=914234 RepID=M2Q815_CERS8|nr:hypothetical protein CERSUDRAFT_98958 [Gelatoporia subvermispora B]